MAKFKKRYLTFIGSGVGMALAIVFACLGFSSGMALRILSVIFATLALANAIVTRVLAKKIKVDDFIATIVVAIAVFVFIGCVGAFAGGMIYDYIMSKQLDEAMVRCVIL